MSEGWALFWIWRTAGLRLVRLARRSMVRSVRSGPDLFIEGWCSTQNQTSSFLLDDQDTATERTTPVTNLSQPDARRRYDQADPQLFAGGTHQGQFLHDPPCIRWLHMCNPKVKRRCYLACVFSSLLILPVRTVPCRRPRGALRTVTSTSWPSTERK